MSGTDGRSVRRGGAGQQILGFTSDAPAAVNGAAGVTRQIFTEPASQLNGTASTLLDLDGDATTAEDATSSHTTLLDAYTRALHEQIQDMQNKINDGGGSGGRLNNGSLNEA